MELLKSLLLLVAVSYISAHEISELGRYTECGSGKVSQYKSSEAQNTTGYLYYIEVLT